MSAEPLLRAQDLAVSFRSEEGVVRAVDGVSLEVARGDIVAIVGESGSGKSVTALTLMGLTRGANAEISGSAELQGTELLGAREEELRRLRGRSIAMIFQDPMSSLNPVHRVGDQIVEQILAHERVPREQAWRRAVELLDTVGIPAASERARSYPHEFSGGMRQRAMIAMALALEPDLLIADEPTTALDVTIQAQILRLLGRLNRERGLAVVLITHDLGVVAEVANRVLVMYAGRIVEEGSLDEIFYDPQHPYTWGLLGSLTRVDEKRPQRLPQIPGQPPSLISPPQGCHFRPRCPHEFDRCPAVPALEARDPQEPAHRDRCWLEPEEKRRRRVVGDRIGLAAPEGDRA